MPKVIESIKKDLGLKVGDTKKAWTTTATGGRFFDNFFKPNVKGNKTGAEK